MGTVEAAGMRSGSRCSVRALATLSTAVEALSRRSKGSTAVKGFTQLGRLIKGFTPSLVERRQRDWRGEVKKKTEMKARERERKKERKNTKKMRAREKIGKEKERETGAKTGGARMGARFRVPARHSALIAAAPSSTRQHPGEPRRRRRPAAPQGAPGGATARGLSTPQLEAATRVAAGPVPP